MFGVLYMKRKFHKTREVFKIKNHLYKIAPHITEVDIKVSNLKNGLYKSQIFVHIPHRKRIVSTKIDESLTNSLEKAQHAITKQIQKAIRPKIKSKTIRRIDLDLAA